MADRHEGGKPPHRNDAEVRRTIIRVAVRVIVRETIKALFHLVSRGGL